MSNPQVAPHSAYLLSYLSQSHEEQERLDSQHDVITHAITGGELIHPSIPPSAFRNSIADIACGTGIWLENVRRKYFDGSASDEGYGPLLVGFDVNAHAFDLSIGSAVTLIEHNCVQEFPSKYIGKFDLVNMRGLAYAIPEQEFCRLVSNACQLLRE
jgi:SAM-dependent methyltransferase